VRFYTPEAVFMTDDGGECTIRKYAGHYQAIGPYTGDSMGSFQTCDKARDYIEERFGPGTWTEGRYAAAPSDGGEP
jgi:hypothetical protein